MRQESIKCDHKRAYKKISKWERRVMMKFMIRQTIYIGKEFKCSKYYMSKNNPNMQRAIDDADAFLERLEKRVKRHQQRYN